MLAKIFISTMHGKNNDNLGFEKILVASGGYKSITDTELSIFFLSKAKKKICVFPVTRPILKFCYDRKSLKLYWRARYHKMNAIWYSDLLSYVFCYLEVKEAKFSWTNSLP